MKPPLNEQMRLRARNVGDVGCIGLEEAFSGVDAPPADETVACRAVARHALRRSRERAVAIMDGVDLHGI
jgi:hypothetical protein